MRYQQLRARMSPNWKEKEAMNTQKLIAAAAGLHLKQDEEVTKLRRNVGSLAKKNHGFVHQVHGLVSRLRQYSPLRIPEDTRPTNQGENRQRPPSPGVKEEDTEMEDTVQTPTNRDNNYQAVTMANRPPIDMEYERLPPQILQPLEQQPPLKTPPTPETKPQTIPETTPEPNTTPDIIPKLDPAHTPSIAKRLAILGQHHRQSSQDYTILISSATK
ncbi:hypothetical protein DFP73DRAFT_587579 [Morchella snyderi]|nr:hypothetical protein DFP73DRAFT_587579 [Morchella snyderi]